MGVAARSARPSFSGLRPCLTVRADEKVVVLLCTGPETVISTRNSGAVSATHPVHRRVHCDAGGVGGEHCGLVVGREGVEQKVERGTGTSECCGGGVEGDHARSSSSAVGC